LVMRVEIDYQKNLARIIEKSEKQDYWVRIPQKWWRETLSGLRPTQRCLLISLRIWGAKRAKIDQLAKELGIKWETAKKHLDILRKKGLI